MSAKSRLRTAIDDGLLILPEGTGSLVRPAANFDVGSLAGRELSIVSTFAPEFDQWAAAGYEVGQSYSKSAFTVVNIPRSKPFAKSLVAKAAMTSDLVVVDGDKTDGIDSIFKACRKELGDLPSVTKNHGRMFWFQGTQTLADWVKAEPTKGPHGFYTTPGVFSGGVIDKGSEQLVMALPDDLSGHIADLGAGWGYLSAQLLKRKSVGSVTLVEAEHLALDCARLNVADDRATFVWADATQYSSINPFDHVVMNPPFHTGREGDPSLGQAFIKAAARILKPKGSLWMVANRHLPYEATLSECFQKVTPLDGAKGFKLFKASRPKR